MAKSLVYRRLRAPRHDKGLLLDPSWSECLKMAADNSALFQQHDCDLHGRRFQELRTQVRRDLLRKAVAYTNDYVDVQLNDDSNGTFILSGHQPALFHPGVWAKNFAIDRMAKETGGTAIQVVIDNDAMRSHSIVVPTGDLASPARVSEPFDDYHDANPYELRFAKNKSVLQSFPQRVSDHVQSFVAEPLVNALWPDVCEAVDQGKPLGHAFAMARHRVEHRWGLNTLEIPLSQLCESFGFRWFMLDLLLRADSVRSSYNERLQEYRTLHRLRNHAQPLPDLQTQDGWTETPFWIWSGAEPQRNAVWIRRSGNDLELSKLKGHSGLLVLKNAFTHQEDAVGQLEEYSTQGWRLRPRALANTMFLRLFCADTFVHGIGGAKYDQVCDTLIHDLFGFPIPRFAVLSLTAYLPTPLTLLGDREIIHKQRLLREMYFHPERFLHSQMADGPQVSSKVNSKRKLIASKPSHGSASEWHRVMCAVNEELRGYLQKKTEKEKKNLSDLLRQRESTEIFSSREWSFCLFEESFLRSRLLDLSCENSYSSGAE